MRPSKILAWSAALALTLACGKLTRPRGQPAVPAASGASSGAGGLGTADSGEGGMPPETTAGTGGGAGTSSAGSGGGASGGRAGASTAGPAGGGPSMGGAPVAGAPNVTLPDDCSRVGQHVGETFCSAEMICDDKPLTVSCTADLSGQWLCSCLRDGGSTLFRFPDANGTTTCNVAAKGCLHPELLTGEETCTRTDKVDGPNCAILDSCLKNHEVEGVKVATQTEWQAECGAVATNISGCTCQDSLEPDIWLEPKSFASGCGFLSALCKDGEPAPLHDWSCEPVFEDAGPGYGCHSGSFCQRPIRLDDGTDLTQVEQYNLNCRTTDGRTRCTCEGVAGVEKVTLVVPLPADDIDACRLTTDVCSEVESFEPTGSPDCKRSDESATPTNCTLARDCSQPGVTADTQVTTLTHVNASCLLRDDGSWFCSCNEGWPAQHLTLSIDADSSADACAQVLDECPPIAPGL